MTDVMTTALHDLSLLVMTGLMTCHLSAVMMSPKNVQPPRTRQRKVFFCSLWNLGCFGYPRCHVVKYLLFFGVDRGRSFTVAQATSRGKNEGKMLGKTNCFLTSNSPLSFRPEGVYVCIIIILFAIRQLQMYPTFTQNVLVLLDMAMLLIHTYTHCVNCVCILSICNCRMANEITIEQPQLARRFSVPAQPSAR